MLRQHEEQGVIILGVFASKRCKTVCTSFTMSVRLYACSNVRMAKGMFIKFDIVELY
jgi:hypothetical protein